MASWFLRKTRGNTVEAAKILNVSTKLATILLNRGIKSKEDALAFLNPDISFLHNAMLMDQMPRAIKKIKDDIINKRKIAIYGDYDVDGVMSTVILYRTLKSLGADVYYYVPHRQKEGYGLNIEAVQTLADSNTQTILACDNGISAIEEIDFANKLNIDVVILDHHETGEVLPNAYAIVDPKKAQCKYPFKMLCAGAISFKFSQLLSEAMDADFDFNENLIFAGIATVCDIVDLYDENRIIVYHALKTFKNTKNIGLIALMNLLGIDASNVTAFNIGFMIGPCINATGRLESAKDSIELFLCDDCDAAGKLAGKLYDLNVARKNFTQNAVKRVINTIEKTSIKDDKVFVVYDDEIHESIAGIVAGRVKETYYHPTIVLTNSEECAKGSARSIPAYNIFQGLTECKDLFIKFGGHPMAAGLSMDHSNIGVLRELLNNNCQLLEEDFLPKISIDCVLSPDNADFALCNELSMLEPYGKANEKPIFGITNLNIRKVDVLGSNCNTLKFHGYVNNKVVYIMAFNAYQLLEQKINEAGSCYNIQSGANIDWQMDFCYTVGINNYRGNLTVQLVAEDFRFTR